MSEKTKKQKTPVGKTTKVSSNATLAQFFLNQKFVILSFFIPVLLISTVFALHKVFPFGDQQIIANDFYVQYYPFLSGFYDKLHNGTSMLWSWDIGLGTNYIAIIAYYLSSPLNLLLFYFPHNMLPDAVTAILIAKIGFAGSFMAIFLRGTFKHNDLSLILFSLPYSLCAFTTCYYWNIMWLDAFTLLPLVILGIYALIVKGHYKTYIISLAITMITNYYIGYISCIFTLLSFFAIMFILKPSTKVFFKKLLSTAIFSILALSIGMVFMIPSLMNLQDNSLANTNISSLNLGLIYCPAFFSLDKWDYSNNVLKYIFDILCQFTPFNIPTSFEGLPNIYCTFVCLILAVLFFKNNKISTKEKIASIILLSVLILSCVFTISNFVLQGFHMPNSLPYRFSFLISFVVIVMAYRLYSTQANIQNSDIITVIVTGVVFVFLHLLGIETALSYGKEINLYAIIAICIITIIVCVFMLLRKNKKISKQIFSVCLLVVMIIEIGINAYNDVDIVTTSNRDDYPYMYDQVESLINYVSEKDAEPFYRIEYQTPSTGNDPSLYNFNGASSFSSTSNSSALDYVASLGFIGSGSSNRGYFRETSPLASSFLGIKYMVSKSDVAHNTNNWEFIMSTVQGGNIYQNKTYLPIGFMVDNSIKKFHYNKNKNNEKTDSKFEVQNNLFTKATGIDEDIFTSVDFEISKNDLELKKADAEKSYYVKSKSDNGKITYTCNIQKDNTELYAYINARNCTSEYVTLTINSNTKEAEMINISYPSIPALGVFKKGDKVEISIPYLKDVTDLCCVTFASFNEDVFKKGYDILNDETLNITSEEGSVLSGTITSKSDGILYTSISYDSGWKAYIDGVETEILPLADGAVIGIKLNSGTHNIRFEFFPKGFVPSIIMCVSSIIILIAIILFEELYLKKKNKTLLSAIPNNLW